MPDFLATALQAMEAAEKITLKYYQKDPEVSIKADQSPVTIADKMAEQAIMEAIRSAFPDHAFFGEESGYSGDSEYRWIIDPIDGTKNFIAGIPLWGTLIALMHRDEVILGVSRVPLQDQTVHAVKGRGAYMNGERIHVSETSELSDAMISFGSIYCFTERGLQRQLMQLLHDCRRHRAFGDLWPVNLTAAGTIDVVIEGALKAYDLAPFDVIFREAGGVLTDLDGNPFSTEITSVIATNRELHPQVVRYFQQAT